MKRKTDDQIVAFVKQTVRDGMLADGMSPEATEYNWNRVIVRLDRNDKDEVRITCGKMYEAPPLTLGMLMKYAEFFGTKNINDSRFANGGCETCDYGSSYGYTLIIKPEVAA